MKDEVLNLDLYYQHLRTGFKNMQSQTSCLSELHELITPAKECGDGYYISVRRFPNDEVEAVGIKLDSETSLKRGGGAVRKNEDKDEMDVPTLNKSIARARTNVRRRLLSMSADRLLTLTFKENVTDIDEAWKVFKSFVRLMRKRYRDHWCYVAVPEYQKRGAVHFHLAISGFYHANTVRRIWRKACGDYQGNIDITSPRKAGKNSWNPRRISNYLSKYMCKCDTVNFNRKRFSSGGNIKVPEPIKGWLEVGGAVIYVMRDVVNTLSRKDVRIVHEVDGWLGITFLST